ncbi:MAG: Ser-Thr-rich GPI-anchored membrane family protein, partial [Ignavibacteriaceae bacterium]
MNNLYFIKLIAILVLFSNIFPQIFAQGFITITSPNGGESWQAGTSQEITWTDNLPGSVTIELYKGGLLNSVISAGTASNGSKTWDIPLSLVSGSDYSIRITSIDSVFIFDSSPDFTIFPPVITVTSPNGSDNWLIGDAYLITWTDNISEDVELHLYKGGFFNSVISSSTPSDGSYAWLVPSGTTPGTDYQIRISSVSNGNIFDESDANFALSNEIIVTTPNGGESWQTGSSQIINWTDNLSGNVQIELFKGGVLDSEITPSTESDGSFSWDIPISTLAGLDYSIKITSVDNASIFDFSDTNFEIFLGNITVALPNGGESWQAGNQQTISWTDNIAEDVKIDLFKGGLFHSVISTPTTSDGSKSWDIPYTMESGTDYTVKITSIDNPSLTDFSDANFEIVGNQITVLTPNIGESWSIGSSQLITWTDNINDDVDIKLYKGGIFHSTI